MKDDQRQFLTLLGHVPARLTTEQVAWSLNCQPHDIAVLVSARLLKPLGNPQANSTKYFSSAEVQESARDRSWLSKMTSTLSLHWQKKNQRKGAKVKIWSGGANRSELNPSQEAAS